MQQSQKNTSRHSKLSSNAAQKTAGVSCENRFAFIDKLVLYLTVSITGAAVMMLELLGTRIIGPFYGVSLIVWSSLISVTLMALAIGYFIGGRLADREGPVRLSHIIFLAAVYTGAIPLMSGPVQLATDSLGLRAGAFASALILFTVPLALLGMVGPYVIKMAARRLEGVGSTAGNVYAISTLGSVVGTLFLGFYLLPLAGTRIIVMGVSLVLLVLAVGIGIYEYKSLKRSSAPIMLAASSVVFAIAVYLASYITATKKYQRFKVVYEAESHYGWVRVVDEPLQRIRWLMSDSSTIGAEDLNNGEGMLGYQQVVERVVNFKDQPKKALLVGLGSGHIVNLFDRYGIRTDSIEIDPEVARAAGHYFSYQSTGKSLVGDARYQVKQLSETYDFIVHDCFTGGAEPIHLLSVEMLKTLKSKLKPGGVLVLNFVGFSQGENSRAVAAVSNTLDSLFTHKRTFVSAPNEDFNDFIFYASDVALELTPTPANKRVESWLKDREISVPIQDTFIITDDFNPLESMQVAKAERYRELLVDRVGKDILIW